MKLLQLALLGVVLGAQPALAKGLTIEDMLAMQRVGSPAVSPDGRWLAFTVRDTDYEANRGRSDVWLASADGASVRRLTTHPENDTDPTWSPDGRWIYFMSSRGGSSQVWRISPSGGEAEAVTKLPIDLNGFKLFPDGKRLVVAADVWPAARSITESVRRDDEKAKSKIKARVYDQLLFRHWDQWEDGKYSHLFVWTPPELGGKADDAKDLTPGQATDTPHRPFGGMDEVAISPDGKTVAFVARQGGREAAWKTNTDVFLVPATGDARPVALTAANQAYDFEPSFSPDGRWLAVRMMTRAGYEADRERIGLYEVATRKLRVLTEPWDRSASSIAWSRDGKTIYTSADNVGNHSLYAIDVATGAPRLLVDKGTNASPRVAGDRVVFVRDTLKMPAELFSVRPDGTDLRQITRFNEARTKKIEWGEYEQFSVKGARGDTVHGFIA
jgi:Tol biopolymer transport system component